MTQMAEVDVADPSVTGMENKETKEEFDPWAIPDDDGEFEKWSEMDSKRRVRFLSVIFLKIVLVLGCLYLFVCSLSLMGSSFQILAGKTAGAIFRNDSVLGNPVAGLIIGILVTVLVQSSSTSTSIVTTMVGADILQVHEAIPIVMGANIGTSVTNTIVSLSQSLDVVQFRRAFAGATVHDIFNLLSVLVLLPIEVASGMLERMTSKIVAPIGGTDVAPPKILKVITDPLTKKIVQVNKTIIKLVAKNKTLSDSDSMITMYCKEYNTTLSKTVKVRCTTDHFLFADTGLDDGAVGAILLIVSLIALCACLLAMVKLLHSMMKGSIARTIKKVINTDIRRPFRWVAGYLAIIVGAGLTFVVQSSSVFTSTMTPLVGIGVISLKRMYPLTLGANIGTTTTSILAALASDGEALRNTLQIAFCHFFFNIFGIAIWYPIPFMRSIPIRGAKVLGNTTAKYRWFALVYLFMVFFIIPAVILGLSIAHIWAMGAVMIFVAIIAIFVVVVKILQAYRPRYLPVMLRNWKFLPLPLRSLEPYDRVFTVCCTHSKMCRRCCGKCGGYHEDVSEVHANQAAVDHKAVSDV